MTALQYKCTVDATRPQRKRTTEKHLKKRSGEGNVDCGLQVQLQEDKNGSTGQSWMETSGLWSVWERQGISNKDKNDFCNATHEILGARGKGVPIFGQDPQKALPWPRMPVGWVRPM